MKVFVYGTLKKGFGNNVLLATSEFVKEAVTKDTYRAHMSLRLDPSSWTGGWFPMLIAKEDGAEGFQAKGELWEITEDVLLDLDALEGHPHFFRREMIETECGEQAYIYLYQTQEKGHAFGGGVHEWN